MTVYDGSERFPFHRSFLHLCITLQNTQRHTVWLATWTHTTTTSSYYSTHSSHAVRQERTCGGQQQQNPWLKPSLHPYGPFPCQREWVCASARARMRSQRFLHSPWLLAAPSASSHSVRLLTILPLRLPSLPQNCPPLRGEEQKNGQMRRCVRKDGAISAPAFPCREPRGSYRPTEQEMRVFSPLILFFSRSPLLSWL